MSTLKTLLVTIEEVVAKTHGTRATKQIVRGLLKGATSGTFTFAGHTYGWAFDLDKGLHISPKGETHE